MEKFMKYVDYFFEILFWAAVGVILGALLFEVLG
jgi:hypothetical protein